MIPVRGDGHGAGSMPRGYAKLPFDQDLTVAILHFDFVTGLLRLPVAYDRTTALMTTLGAQHPRYSALHSRPVLSSSSGPVPGYHTLSTLVPTQAPSLSISDISQRCSHRKCAKVHVQSSEVSIEREVGVGEGRRFALPAIP